MEIIISQQDRFIYINHKNTLSSQFTELRLSFLKLIKAIKNNGKTKHNRVN